MALIAGLDLGRNADFSVLAVLDRQPRPEGEATPKRRWRYTLRWLQSWDLGTPYPTICGGVADRFGRRTDVADTPLSWAPLAVDYTGVGTAVVDVLRATRLKAKIEPVLITSGHQVQKIDIPAGRAEHHVPKKELVSNLMALLQGGLLRWTAAGAKGALPLVNRFERELQDFREYVTRAKNQTFGAEASQKDDTVLAVMLAAWLGENTGGGDVGGIGLPHAGAGSMLERAPSGTFASDVDYHCGADRGSGGDRWDKER